MGSQRTNGGRDGAIGRLADRQHGVVSRPQLLAVGLTPRMIYRRQATGRLRPIYLGVYAVGHTALRREGWWMAALLACGEGSALSHRSAAIGWEFERGPIQPIEVITPTQGGRKQPRLVVHRMQLDPGDTIVRDGLRITTAARTIVDLAATRPPRSTREIVERAQDRRRFHEAVIRATIARNPHRPGIGPLIDLLELLQPDSDNARSYLERLFLALVRSARLPRPEVNPMVGNRRRDFVWPDKLLVVETDGYRYHSSRQAQRRDRRRDRELTALGWRPVRFTYEEVAFEPVEVARELGDLLGP